MAEIRLLTRVAEVAEALRDAGARSLWIFKHSSSCSVSSRALGEYRRFAEARRSGGEIFYQAEVQRARAVCEEIERLTGVRHETPQALLLIGGRVVWHGSHWEITADALASAVTAPALVGERGRS